jgi:hypothetical protein
MGSTFVLNFEDNDKDVEGRPEQWFAWKTARRVLGDDLRWSLTILGRAVDETLRSALVIISVIWLVAVTLAAATLLF